MTTFRFGSSPSPAMKRSTCILVGSHLSRPALMPPLISEPCGWDASRASVHPTDLICGETRCIAHPPLLSRHAISPAPRISFHLNQCLTTVMAVVSCCHSCLPLCPAALHPTACGLSRQPQPMSPDLSSSIPLAPHPSTNPFLHPLLHFCHPLHHPYPPKPPQFSAEHTASRLPR